MIEIPLTSGYTAKIDDDDSPKVQGRKWFASKYKGKIYAKLNFPEQQTKTP